MVQARSGVVEEEEDDDLDFLDDYVDPETEQKAYESLPTP
jgi:hypothetical protein